MSPQVQDMPPRGLPGRRGVARGVAAPGRTRTTLRTRPLPGTVRVRIGPAPARRSPAGIDDALRGVPS